MPPEDAADWPLEPAACTWELPDPRRLPPEIEPFDMVAIGADLAPGTILAAYRRGLFPMHLSAPPPDADPSWREGALAWWSPDPRAILPLAGLHVSRSLRQSLRRYEVTVDAAFADVMAGCAAGRPDQWINDEIVAAYTTLHRLGWAHSVEVWHDGALVGGLYGLAIGGLFAGESMFHRKRDASKVALVHLGDLLRADGRPRLLDVQWSTSHLASLGAVEVPRTDYLDLLRSALPLPLPPDFDHPAAPS